MSMPDVGGRAGAGRPPNLDYRELEQTAQTQIMKQDLNLMKNTLDVMLTDLGGQNKWNYSSNFSKPILSMFVFVGVDNPDAEQENPLIQQEYEKLFKQLSTKISQRLKENRKLPLEEQDPLCIIFEMVLRFAAKASAWLEGLDISSELFPDSVATSFAAPRLVFASIVTLAKETFKQITQLPTQHHIEMKTVIKNNQEALISLIRDGTDILKDTGTLNEDKLQALLQNLLELQNSSKQKKIHYLLLNVETIIDIAVDQVQGLLLKGTASSGLYGLNTATPVLSTKHNSWLGSSLLNILNTVCHASKKLTATQQHYLSSFSEAFLVMLMTLVIEGSGATRLSGIDITKEVPYGLDDYTTFAVTLSTALFSESGAIPDIVEGFLTQLELPTDVHNFYKHGLCLVAWNLLLIAATKQGKLIKAPQPLFNALAHTLIENLQQLKDVLETQEGAEARRISGLVKQAEIAVNQGSLPGYLETLLELIKPYGFKLDLTQQQMDQLLYEAMVYINASYRAFTTRAGSHIVSTAA